ncbi:MAG: hypothetical protein HY699_18765 [Deltaproteobacteria bacterium]|nr:hypothetical protein [Deltaproteobacteria bacterium]
MTKKATKLADLRIEPPPRARLSAQEPLKRMRGFDPRKDDFVAAVRARKG